MYHYVMLELAYEKKPVSFTVTDNFYDAIELLKKVLNSEHAYLKNAFIESHQNEQFEE